jgi:outer membrane receptor protein involved in Fe transport
LADGADLSGQTPPNIVENSATLNANFRMPAMAGFDFVTDVQVSHNGEMQGGKPWDNVKNPDFTVVDLQMGFVSDRWEVLLNVENLFDQAYYTDLEPFPNFSFDGLIGAEPATIIIGTHGQPQLITGSVTYRF